MGGILLDLLATPQISRVDKGRAGRINFAQKSITVVVVQLVHAD